MDKKKLRVAITHGDTNGVGYELIFKTFAEDAMLDICTPVVYGSAKVAAYHRKALDMPGNFHIISSAEAVEEGRLNLVNCFDEEVKVELGCPTPESGQAALMALERAVADCRDGLVDVLVTAPICKAAIQGPDFAFSGHTEYLADRLEATVPPLMILCNSTMRVALATAHLPLSAVPAAVTPELLDGKIRQLYEALRRDFRLSAPRIAVLGLNPHNGDDGLMGSEEKDVIAPAIARLADEGIPCFGPFPADGFFGAGSYTRFDAVLAMYHDQGLAPFKALAMEDGVNVTAGLPVVRTSPDHGTAYDIAGCGTASPASMRAAIYAAIDIWRNRAAYDEENSHPLEHLYHERRSESSRPKSTPQEGEA